MRFLIPRPQFLKYIMDIINDCIWPMKFLLGFMDYNQHRQRITSLSFPSRATIKSQFFVFSHPNSEARTV